jgi:putative phosphoesterase
MSDWQNSSREYDLRHQRRLRLAILSDTHGYLDPSVAAVANACDVVLHAGDIMDPAVLDVLQPESGKVIAVRGNNDIEAIWGASSRSVLEAIPDTALIRCAGGDIVMEHGHRLASIDHDHFPLAYRYPDARLVVYGHTHRLRLDDDQRPWLLNPGAAGDVRTGGGPSCCCLHIDGDHWRIEISRFSESRKAG